MRRWYFYVRFDFFLFFASLRFFSFSVASSHDLVFSFWIYLILSSCSFVSFYVCSFELYKFPLCLTFFSSRLLVRSFVRFSVAYNTYLSCPTHTQTIHSNMLQTTRKCLIFSQHSLKFVSLDCVIYVLLCKHSHTIFEAKQKKKRSNDDNDEMEEKNN